VTGRRDYAPVFIRLFAGVFLVYMSQDNVLSWERMREFEGFLRRHGFPFPLLCAMVSVGAQFTCGLLFLLGAFVRWAALVMVVNFVVAIVMVHLALPFREALDPAAMLASALSLAYSGAGALSVDAWRAGRSTNTSSNGRDGKK
jgi:putative oxidoreductase